MIDWDELLINTYGNNRLDNLPQEQRITAAPNSNQKAISDLLLKFYDKTWYANLSHWDNTLLKPKPALYIPALVAYD